MRFATAGDVLLAYPQMAIGFRSALDETPSLAYLDRLVARAQWGDAIAFLAHLLPRREAVWWAASCVRREPGSFDPPEEALIVAAESWVRDPVDGRRRHALELGETADALRAASWVARAAGWSGGVLIEADGTRIMCQPHMSPAAARGAVLLASAASANPLVFLDGCVNEAMILLKRNSNH